ncbi:MAG TPA: FMN-binding protein [Burkholderiales bacterium]|nr:FMN-binding protein [Burkholderiales bacterium]
MSFDIRWLAPAAIVSAAPAYCLAAHYMSLEQAQALIFAQAQEFVPAAVTLTPDQIGRIERESGVQVRAPQQQVWQARAAGKLLGWFIVDQVIGKHELITYALGINADGSVRQFQVIEYREQYGYQVRELKWRDQFVGKTVSDPLQVGTDIVNISGATLSCRHVTDGIKRLLAFHQVVLR